MSIPSILAGDCRGVWGADRPTAPASDATLTQTSNGTAQTPAVSSLPQPLSASVLAALMLGSYNAA